MPLVKFEDQIIKIHTETFWAAYYGICQGCGVQDASVVLSNRNTMFPHEGDNFAVFCDDCRKDDDDYYAERWADYYSDIAESVSHAMLTMYR